MQSLLVVVVILAAWFPRALGLDRLVTPDEPLWFGWSAGFSQAIASGDFQATQQGLLYPGVTLMWLATAGFHTYGPEFPVEVIAQLDSADASGTANSTGRGIDWVDLLFRLRMVMIVCNVAILVAALFLTARLFSVEVAGLGILLIALDPFDVALTRLFQVDGLTGGFMLVSILGMLTYLYRDRRWSNLVLSAGAGGLAMLTRSTSLFLVAFLALLVAIDWWTRRERCIAQCGMLTAVRTVAIWSVVAIAVVVALWPALWVDPVGTFGGLVERNLGKAGRPHNWQTFFNGAVHREDPGWLFYPFSYLWRTTPAVLIGLTLAAGVAVFPKSRARIRAVDGRALLALLVFVVLYGAALTLASKKFDRYLFPILAPMCLIAAWGWIEVTKSVASARWAGRGARLGTLVAAVVTAMQISSLAPSFPYYLSYYNPLLGGPPRAVETMPIGWGEGFDQIADYLNELPDVETTPVTAGPWSKPFAYFYDGPALTTVYTDPAVDRDVRAFVNTGDPLLQWAMADYRVVYISEWQREFIPRPLLDYFAERSPELTVTIQGLEYARLYDLRQAPLPDAFLGEGTSVTEWDGAIRLVALQLPEPRLARGSSISIVAYVQSLAHEVVAASDLVLVLDVVDRNNVVVRRATAAVLPPAKPRTVWPIDLQTRLPAFVKTGNYRLEIRFLTREGTPLTWSSPGLAEKHDTPIAAGTVAVRNRVGGDRVEPADNARQPIDESN